MFFFHGHTTFCDKDETERPRHSRMALTNAAGSAASAASAEPHSFGGRHQPDNYPL